MSAPPSREETAGRAYNDLRKKARASQRATQELLLLYDRLRAAGVPVRYTNYLSTAHGFFSAPRLARLEPQAMSELVQELSAALTKR